jgi:hypothetical protein
MEENMNERLVKMQDGVKALHDKILDESHKNQVVNDLYGGCEIYFSPFIENPDVMLLGINPGSGFKNENGIPVASFVPPEQHGKTNLIGDLEGCFNRLGNKNIINNTFVTNVYFFSTYGTESFNQFLAALPKDLKDELIDNSKIWVKELIIISSPKIIVCAGSAAFDCLRNHKSEMITIQNKYPVFEGIFNNIPVIGYPRGQGGWFKNTAMRDQFTEKLGEYLIGAGIIA